MFNPKKEEGEIGVATETIVGASVKLEGEFSSKGDITINGNVIGKVTTESNLGIGQSAIAKADLEAENVVIAGTVEGNVKAKEKLEITESGKVQGNISAKVLSVLPGAFFSGQCEMGALKVEETAEKPTEERTEKVEG